MNPFHSLSRCGLIGLVLASLPLLAAAQNQAAYDVSTVKPHDSGNQNMNWSEDDAGFRAVGVRLRDLIADAWHLRPDQISGEPAWFDDLEWDVASKSTELSAEQLRKLTREQRAIMQQQFLADRFHLKAHLESRTGPIFTLVPAKGGVKLKPIARTAEEKASGAVTGSSLSVMGGEAVTMEAKKNPLSQLLDNLAFNLRKTVIDRTGLPADAVYSFTLRWDPENGTGPNPDTEALPISAALEEQLGLHLEAGKGPVQVLIVDHVERPTAD